MNAKEKKQEKGLMDETSKDAHLEPAQNRRESDVRANVFLSPSVFW